MSILLGVDTGGTYTDAVLMQGEARVLARAKALTTRHDLAEGIGAAVGAVLEASGVAPGDVAMASLSTTLATNALVEGQGGRAALIYVGFDKAPAATPGLAEALGDDPVCVLAGGHRHDGAEAAALDEVALRGFLDGCEVSGFAVAAQFGTRNPAHEQRVAEIVRDMTGAPVSASHQLSSKLGGPKRALTALLNARLIGMIDTLIRRAEAVLEARGIAAPLMVVRGDGALMSAAQARVRPIETILSGPAASIVGARWLTGVDEALVSDIGGTTTDVAMLRGGVPAIDPQGARVGPHRTMVEAVAMRTTGLGGDSEVHFVSEGLAGGVTLGPARVVPVSLLAVEAPDVVLSTLEAQVATPVPGDHDARFVRAVPGVAAGGLGAREAALLERIGDGVHPVGDVLRARVESGALRRLVARGLVQVAGLTPSDASHVLGYADAWDGRAARLACALMARRRTGSGEVLARSPEDMARIVVDRLTHQTGLALLEAGLAQDGLPEDLAGHVLMQRGLGDHGGAVRVATGLAVPVVGLGASAGVYYPAVGELLGTKMILPEDAGVANAIGAVVGQITVRKRGTVTAQGEGRYRVHLESGPEDFAEEAPARARLRDVLEDQAQAEVLQGGADEAQVSATWDIRRAQVENRAVFVEGTLVVEASGRPRVAL
ncbi:MAG: hydantoinase/oxoprolinase family protein [Pseudomonadota bacterium]